MACDLNGMWIKDTRTDDDKKNRLWNQLVGAMTSLTNQLEEDDEYNLIIFDHKVEVWKLSEMHTVSNKDGDNSDALNYLQSLSGPRGGTRFTKPIKDGKLIKALLLDDESTSHNYYFSRKHPGKGERK